MVEELNLGRNHGPDNDEVLLLSLDFQHHLLDLVRGQLLDELLELFRGRLEEIFHFSDLGVELHHGFKGLSDTLGLDNQRGAEECFGTSQPLVQLLQT